MNNSERLARALCSEMGIDEGARVCREPPIVGPQGMNFYYVPDRSQAAWEMFIPLARIALENLGKLKISED